MALNFGCCLVAGAAAPGCAGVRPCAVCACMTPKNSIKGTTNLTDFITPPGLPNRPEHFRRTAPTERVAFYRNREGKPADSTRPICERSRTTRFSDYQC